MLYMMRAALLLIVLIAPVIAASVVWKEGKLLDLAISEPRLPNGKPATRKTFVFRVDGGDKVYEGQEDGRHAPRVEVNAPIQKLRTFL